MLRRPARLFRSIFFLFFEIDALFSFLFVVRMLRRLVRSFRSLLFSLNKKNLLHASLTSALTQVSFSCSFFFVSSPFLNPRHDIDLRNTQSVCDFIYIYIYNRQIMIQIYYYIFYKFLKYYIKCMHVGVYVCLCVSLVSVCLSVSVCVLDLY